MKDQEIVALFEARIENALQITAQRYGAYCHSIAYGILRNDEDAEECVSDAYLRAWNAIPPHHPENLRTFLGKIVRRLAISRLEKQTAQKRGGGQMSLALEELAECLPSGDSLTEEVILRDTLDRFLSSLSPKTRVVFLRRYWYMQSAEEIAQSLQMNVGNVHVTLHRARGRLRDMMEKDGVEDE